MKLDVLLHCDEATRKVVFLLGKNRKSAMENIDRTSVYDKS